MAILVSASRPYCLTTPTTPTIVKGFLGSNHRCFPIGSSCDQKRCANLSSLTTNSRSVSDRIIVRPKTLREFVVNDDCLRHVHRVMLGEKATLHQRNFHCAKVVSARSAHVDLQLLAWGWLIAFHADASPT